MFVNICMAVKGREKLTWQAISSLYRNTDRKFFSLTVVDDQSDHATAKMLKDLSGYCGFHLVGNEETLGVGGTKNRGAQESLTRWGKGEFLYLSDNDVYFAAGWLDALIIAEAEFSVALIGGYCHPYSRPNQILGTFKANDKEYVLATRDAIGGLSWFLRWETWEKYGKLKDDARGTCMSEDWEYCQRIRADGGEVAAVDPHVVHNTGRMNSFGQPSPGWNVASPDVKGVYLE